MIGIGKRNQQIDESADSPDVAAPQEEVQGSDEPKSPHVIAADVAMKEFRQMEMAFQTSVTDKDERDRVLDAIRRGAIDLDSDGPALTYRLQRPIALENGEVFNSVTLEEPPIEELFRASQGQGVTVDGKTNQVRINDSDQWARVIKTLTVVGGVPLGVVNRIKRRDAMVLLGLSAFFQ